MVKRGKLHSADGKVIIQIQNGAPTDAAQRKNWLSAPKEGLQLVARSYGPRGPLIDGSCNMPGVARAD